MVFKKRGKRGMFFVILLGVFIFGFLFVSGSDFNKEDKVSDEINGLEIPRGKAEHVDSRLNIQEKQVSLFSNSVEKLSENRGKKYRVIVTMKNPEEIEDWKKQVFSMNEKASKELKKKMRKYAIKQMNNNSLRHKYNSFNGFSGELTKQEIEKLSENSLIKRIDKDEKVHAFLQDSTNIINATSTWDLNVQGQNITGKGETVCIIDSGTDYTHNDLGGCTTQEFLDGNCEKVIGGWDFVNNDPDPMDDFGHGTHVSGIAAANGNLKGVSPNTKIYSVKSLGSSGGGSSVDIISGIENCTSASEEYNISVISMSLGSDDEWYSDYCDDVWGGGVTSAINEAVSNNITVTVASGNEYKDNSISAPACVENATAVGSSTDEDNIASHSNLWNLKMLVAPGKEIISTCLGGGTCSKTGTSMATPHVAGAVALLQRYSKIHLEKELTVSEIENVLNDTGKIIPDSGSGRNYSRIDIFNAVESFFHEVNLISPVNGTISDKDTQNFLCDVSGDSVLNNITFYLWDNNDSVYYNYSENITGGKNNYTLNNSVNNISKGGYKWNCNACDNNGICVYSEKNNSFILNSPPVFNYSKNITSPLNWSEDNNITINLTNRFYDVDNDSLYYNYSENNSILNNLTIEINQSSKIVKIIPNENFYGLRNIVFSAEDEYAKAYSNNVSLNITPVNDPTYFNGTIPNITFKEDNYSIINLSNYFIDVDSDLNYSYECTKEEVKMSFNNNTNIANITPVSDWYGTSDCNISAHSDSNETTDSNNFIVNVTPVNDAPVFNYSRNITDQIWEEDTNITINLSGRFYDEDNDTLDYTYSINKSNTRNITVDLNQSEGIVKIIPDKDFFGLRSIFFTASDENDKAYSNNVTLNGTPVNDKPYFINLKNLRDTKKLPFSYDLNARDVDNLEENLSYSLVNYTNLTKEKVNFTINSSTGLLENSSETSYSSKHLVYARVSDGIDNTTKRFNVTFSSLPRLSYEVFSPNFTTNISKYNETTIQNVTNFTIGVEDKGRINYKENVNLSTINIDKGVNISENHIELKNEIASKLNKKARLTFYGISYTNPQPLRNGQKCSSDVCTEISYNSSTGKYVYDITGFTVYSVREKPDSNEREEDVDDGVSSSSSSGFIPSQTQETNETENKTEEPVMVFESDLEKGKIVSLYTKQKIYSYFNDKEYEILFEDTSVSEDRALFSFVNSSFEIYLNETKKINLDKGSKRDVEMKLINISESEENDLVFLNLSKYTVEVDEKTNETGSDNEEKEEDKIWNNWFFYTGAGIIILTLIVYFVFRNKEKI